MFTDVDKTNSNWKAISYVVDNHLMSGYSDGSFRPNEPITFGELCYILSQKFTSEEKFFNILIQPDMEHWANRYIKCCKDEGILPKKYINKDPDAGITNDELFRIFEHLAILMELPVYTVANLHREIEHKKKATRAVLAEYLYAIAFIPLELFSHAICFNIDKSRYDVVLKFLHTHQKYGYYDRYKHLLPPDVSHAYDTLLHHACIDECNALSHMMEMKKLKEKYFHQLPKGTKIFHYTSLNVLQKLIQPDGRLRLSPIAYLNDSTEGSLGLELAENVMRNKEYHGFFSNWERRYLKGVFVASFILHSTEDQQKNGNIPMWANYGNSGEGCAISIDSGALGADVYQVCYQNKDDANQTNDKFLGYLESLSEYLDNYLEEVKTAADYKINFNFENDSVFVFAKDSVEQVCYLYKISYYAYEEEARIVQFLSLRDAKREENVRDDEIFPRIYSELKEPLQISSVILGPKVAHPERVAVALANQGINADQIFLSKIPYR